MQTTSFEFVPREEVPAFFAGLQEESDIMVPPTVQPALSANEIMTLSLVGDDRDEQQQEPPRPTGLTRINLKRQMCKDRSSSKRTPRTVTQSLCPISKRNPVF